MRSADSTPNEKITLFVGRRKLNYQSLKHLLAILCLCVAGCSIDRDRYEKASYSDAIRKQSVVPRIEFVKVEPDKTVRMIYTTNMRHEVSARPGQELTFKDGQHASMFRIVRASPKDQTATLEYMVHVAGPFYE